MMTWKSLLLVLFALDGRSPEGRVLYSSIEKAQIYFIRLVSSQAQEMIVASPLPLRRIIQQISGGT
jgi:hypothetical protein